MKKHEPCVPVFDAFAALLDILLVVLALGASFFALQVRAKFSGGLMAKPWRDIALAPLFYAAGQVGQIARLAGSDPLLDTVDFLFYAGFVFLLLYGFFEFYSVWNPKGSQE
ncbi:MAG: hypothetical protein HY247_03200 [archaeon]|nr:MAG: hypothetical protein HY247_03200 [archaeon]